MSRSKPKSQPNVPSEPVAPVLDSGVVPPRKSLTRMLAAFVGGIALTALIGTMLLPDSAFSSRSPRSQSEKSESSGPAAKAEAEPELWRAASMADEELATVDIAYLNLLCATGLPGSESIDIAACLKTLDAWAALIKVQTDRNLYRFQKNPEEYEGKEGFFRMMMIVSVLQQDLGVHYNMDRVREIDFKRSQDLFIHGMINNQNGGTCVSMPVLYTAVARRLGYPVSLAVAKGHVLCRWDDGAVQFNIEGAGSGLSTFPDEHYHTWPHPISTDEIERGVYLRSLTPREELSVFMGARGHCLQDNGRKADAFVAYAHAHELDPKLPENLMFLRDAVKVPVDQQALARQKGEAGRELMEAEWGDVMRQNRLNQARLERQYQNGMELDSQYQAYRQRLWNPNTPFVPNSTVNAASPFPPHDPGLPFPN